MPERMGHVPGKIRREVPLTHTSRTKFVVSAVLDRLPNKFALMPGFPEQHENFMREILSRGVLQTGDPLIDVLADTLISLKSILRFRRLAVVSFLLLCKHTMDLGRSARKRPEDMWTTVSESTTYRKSIVASAAFVQGLDGYERMRVRSHRTALPLFHNLTNFIQSR